MPCSNAVIDENEIEKFYDLNRNYTRTSSNIEKFIVWRADKYYGKHLILTLGNSHNSYRHTNNFTGKYNKLKNKIKTLTEINNKHIMNFFFNYLIKRQISIKNLLSLKLF
jgi:hypothetical protein